MGNEQGRELEESERIEALIPWFRRNQLDESERALIGEETIVSPAFQAELVREGELANALETIASEEQSVESRDNETAWANFKKRLPATAIEPKRDSVDARLRPAHKVRLSAWRRLGMPQTRLGWLATAQTAALLAVAVLLIPSQLSQGGNEYQTLSSEGAAPNPVGNAVLVFEPSTDEATMRAILNASHARIVDGPMQNGGYLVAIDEDAFDAGIDELKASEAVLVVEALGSGGEP